MVDFSTTVNIVSFAGLAITILGAAFALGRWTSKVSERLLALEKKIDDVNINLTNHISHYDNELMRLATELINHNERDELDFKTIMDGLRDIKNDMKG